MKSLGIALICFLSLALTGCVTPRATLSYEASAEKNIETFYTAGLSIASSRSDSCYVSVAIPAREKVAGYSHLKVWFLYQNLSSKPYLVTPWKEVKLHVLRQETGEETVVEAVGPNALNQKISQQESSQKFLALLGGALDVASVSSSNLSAASKASAMSYVASGTSAQIATTEYWYSTVRAGLSYSLFQKNTIFPNQSANGYVYFPLKASNWGGLINAIFVSKEYSLALEVVTQDRTVLFKFNPIDLE